MGIAGVVPSTKDTSLLVHLEHIQWIHAVHPTDRHLIIEWVNSYLERFCEADQEEITEAGHFLKDNAATMPPDMLAKLRMERAA